MHGTSRVARLHGHSRRVCRRSRMVLAGPSVCRQWRPRRSCPVVSSSHSCCPRLRRSCSGCSTPLNCAEPVCEREPGDCAATERILFRIIVFIGALHGLVMLQLTEALGCRRGLRSWRSFSSALAGERRQPAPDDETERLGGDSNASFAPVAGTSGWRSTESVDTSRWRWDS